MTREEEIRQAGVAYTIANKPKCIAGDNFADVVEELNRNVDFEAGAKWADEHPHWERIVKRLQEEITNDLRNDRWISVEKEGSDMDFEALLGTLKDITDREEYARQLGKIFLGGHLPLETILLMAMDFGQLHPHWISVEDELPKLEKNVLMWSSGFDDVLFGYRCRSGEKGWYCYTDDGYWHNITHWMYLPSVENLKKKEL